MILLINPFLPQKTTFIDVTTSGLSGIQLRHVISEKQILIPNSSFICNGRYVSDHDQITDGSVIHVVLSLPGGKGGFGSMLRAIGAQIEKTTNREACRDLSGRRLRDINEENRLKRWIAKQAERERQRAEQRKAKLERLRSMPNHEFHDAEYNKHREQLPEKIVDAVSHGLKSTDNPPVVIKRKMYETARKPKKPRLWIGTDVPDSDESSEDSEEQRSENVTSSDENSNSCEAKVTTCVGSSILADAELSRPGCSSEQSNLTGSDSESQGENSNQEVDKQSKESNSEVALTTKDSHNESTMPDNKLDTTRTESAATIKDAKEVVFKIPEMIRTKLDSLNEKPVIPSQNSKNEALDIPVKNVDKKEPGPSDVDDKEPVELCDYNGVEELETLGLNRLKFALMARGMKCGGTLKERAKRLWAVRGLKLEEIDPALKAKPSKK